MNQSIISRLLFAAALLPSCSDTKTSSSEPPPALSETAILSYSGFSGPERVLYDSAHDRYLVSNVSGDPVAKDNDGFISVLSPDGSVTSLKWIAGGQNGVTLSAPKGLALQDGVLFVADIDVVRRFDAESGAPLGEIAVDGSTFLNGVSASSAGNVYVSDSGPPQGTLDAVGTEAIYRIEGGTRAVPIVKAPLGRPTALEWSTRGLLVAPFGNSELFRVDNSGKKRDVTALPAGGIASVLALGDWLYITSWQAQAVLRGKLGGRFEPVLQNQSSPTDLGYDSVRKRLIVPHYTDDRVDVFAFE